MLHGGYLDQGPKKEKPPAESPKTRLTARQREIVQLLAEGKSSKEVRRTIGIERENRGNAPCEHHAAAWLSFSHRGSPLRRSQ